jgi:hypothetical protein
MSGETLHRRASDLQVWDPVNASHLSSFEQERVRATEARALYLTRKYKVVLSELQTSQTNCRLTELLLHEMGHVLAAGRDPAFIKQAGCLPWAVELVLEGEAEDHNDVNELRASAATSLALDYMYLPYDRPELIRATHRNTRSMILSAWETEVRLIQLRHQPEVQIMAAKLWSLIAGKDVQLVLPPSSAAEGHHAPIARVRYRQYWLGRDSP